MIVVSKALVIDTPWINHILAGEKTWEMRSRATSQRGWIGLIRKGSGLVVGLARLDECGAPLSRAELIATRDRHGIPESVFDASHYNWNIPWKFGAVRRLKPTPYRHKLGAVIWVMLDDDVIEVIAAQGEGLDPAPQNLAPAAASELKTPAPARPAAPKPQAVRAAAPAPTIANLIGETELNAGNLNNNHFYMSAFIQKFPADLVGGGNKDDLALKTAILDWGGGAPVETDIDGKKKLFRKRGWVGRFFADNDAAPGDSVRVEQAAPYLYRVSLIKRGTL